MESIFNNVSNINHDFLRQFHEYISLSGNLDFQNIDLNSIHTPIALIKTNTHHLIYANQCFKEKFNIDDNQLIIQSKLQDYIKPYTIEQVFSLLKENSYLLIPKIFPSQDLNNYQNPPLGNYFELYSLSINLVTWQSEKVIVAIFYQLLHNSIVDLSLQLSQFSSLINNLPAVIYQCRNDHNWTMEYISDNCWDLIGYSASEFRTHHITYNSLIYDQDKHLVWEKIQEAIASRSLFEIEYRVVHHSGEIKWVWEQGKGIYSPMDELLYLEGLIVDINDKCKKEQEKSLLLNITQAITSAVDFETALLYTLQKVCQLTHWDFGEAWLSDNQGEFFSFSTAWFPPEKNYQQGDNLSLTEFKQQSQDFHFSQTIGLTGKIWAKKKTIWLEEISKSKWFLRAKLASECGLKTGFGVPIMAGEEVVAILIFFPVIIYPQTTIY